MQGKAIVMAEVIISIVLVWMGLAGIHVLWIDSARSAAITLGVIGAVFCAANSYKFLITRPGHPISIVGSVIGVVAVIGLLVQVFDWKGFPILGNSNITLVILGLGIITKGVMGRFQGVLRPVAE
ncbi:MAG: hypothetical protein K2J95_00360 [Lachnospiraceae bacterium]|nr:hypothetical protein [Lachnospiraceae bacterium]